MSATDELVTPRVVLILGLVGIPAAGPLSWSVPQLFDPMGPRLVVAGLAAMGLWLGARTQWGRNYLREVAFAVSAACFAWFQFAAYHNHQSVDDVIGLLVISIAASMVVSTRRQLALSAVAAVVGFLALGALIEPQFPTPITVLLFCSLYGGAWTVDHRAEGPVPALGPCERFPRGPGRPAHAVVARAHGSVAG